MSVPAEEPRRRWRLVLGEAADNPADGPLQGRDAELDAALGALYESDEDGGRAGGLGSSAPRVARWLGDVRRLFPTSVVRVVQRDAIERAGLRQLLLEPELLETVEPDLELVTTLLALKEVVPAKSRETARRVVGDLVRELEARLEQRTRQAVRGALDRSARTRRPRPGDIDWPGTIRRNLRHYRPELGTIVPEDLVGYGRRSRALQREVVLLVDQSGSMAASVVYASVFASVLASIGTLRTRLVVFDTAVVDLTEHLADPVEVLFATQLGGGTDIEQALRYAQGLVTRPQDTVLVLVSDLFEGGDPAGLRRRVGELVGAGVTVVPLLALADGGAPAYDHGAAADLAALGAPAFACTPDRFPDLMAAAIEGRDVGAWAAEEGLVTSRPAGR